MRGNEEKDTQLKLCWLHVRYKVFTCACPSFSSRVISIYLRSNLFHLSIFKLSVLICVLSSISLSTYRGFLRMAESSEPHPSSTLSLLLREVLALDLNTGGEENGETKEERQERYLLSSRDFYRLDVYKSRLGTPHETLLYLSPYDTAVSIIVSSRQRGRVRRKNKSEEGGHRYRLLCVSSSSKSPPLAREAIYLNKTELTSFLSFFD